MNECVKFVAAMLGAEESFQSFAVASNQPKARLPRVNAAVGQHGRRDFKNEAWSGRQGAYKDQVGARVA